MHFPRHISATNIQLSITTVPTELETVSAHMTEAINQLTIELNPQSQFPSHLHAKTILYFLKSRLSFLQISIDDSIHDFNKHPVHARSKMGLVDALGRASQFLFGTAMDSDVQDLRKHYTQLVSMASANRRVINLNSNRVASLQPNVKDLLEHTNTLRKVLNNAITRINQITSLWLLDQPLLVLETSVCSSQEF